MRAKKKGVVRDFCFCAGNGSDYYIDTVKFNNAISEWAKHGKKFCGIIHSHPNELSGLSPRDVDYARCVLGCNPFLVEVYMGIVTVHDSNIGDLYMYSVQNNVCEQIEIEVIQRP